MKRGELFLPSDSEGEQRLVRSSQSPTEASDKRELPQLDTSRRPRKLRRATETPRERAIAAAEKHARDDDQDVEDDAFSLGNCTDGSSSSDESFAAVIDDTCISARSDARRRWYLVTWSSPLRPGPSSLPQRKSPAESSRQGFVDVVQSVYRELLGSGVQKYVCVQEKHASGAPHFHMALLHEKYHRWRDLAGELRYRGVYADFKEFNTYAQAVAYCTEASSKKTEADLDTEPLWSTGHHPVTGRRRVTDLPAGAEEAVPARRAPPRNRPRPDPARRRWPLL